MTGSSPPAPVGEERTFVFDTTTDALWAEEVAGGEGIPTDVVPAPAGSDAKCDLALVTLARFGDVLSDALMREGVPFKVWHGDP